MNEINKLTEYLSKLPGIGPRQAGRLAYFLVRRNDDLPIKLADAIRKARTDIKTCTKCQRLYSDQGKNNICDICSTTRDDLLMIIPNDLDLKHIEKTGSYHGNYFVLGGTVPILEKNPEKKIKIEVLKSILKSDIYPDLKEIILAFNANPEGDNTVDYLKKELSPIAKEKNIEISTLGRGLSTGSELEYADKNTLDNALEHRVHSK